MALRYIAGGLSATVDDGEWVITSYLAANAIILPITGWLIAHIGRRNYFLLSIAVFTLASGMCGMATGLGQLILVRVLQGLAGGGLQPSSQGVLLDAFPVGAAAYLYTPPALRGGAVGLLEPAAQRGRQCRDLTGADDAGTPRPVPQPPSWRMARSLQRGRACLPRSGFRCLPATNWRPGRRAATGLANAREPAPATGICARLVRCGSGVLAVVMVALVFVVSSMKRSVAEKGVLGSDPSARPVHVTSCVFSKSHHEPKRE